MGSSTKDYNESLEDRRIVKNDKKMVKTTIFGDMEFKDISNEKYREYTFFKEGELCKLRIDKPQWLNYNPKSGGHRIVDAKGMSHYVPGGWIHLTWDAKDSGGFQF